MRINIFFQHVKKKPNRFALLRNLSQFSLENIRAVLEYPNILSSGGNDKFAPVILGKLKNAKTTYFPIFAQHELLLCHEGCALPGLLEAPEETLLFLGESGEHFMTSDMTEAEQAKVLQELSTHPLEKMKKTAAFSKKFSKDLSGMCERNSAIEALEKCSENHLKEIEGIISQMPNLTGKNKFYALLTLSHCQEDDIASFPDQIQKILSVSHSLFEKMEPHEVQASIKTLLPLDEDTLEEILKNAPDLFEKLTFFGRHDIISVLATLSQASDIAPFVKTVPSFLEEWMGDSDKARLCEGVVDIPGDCLKRAENFYKRLNDSWKTNKEIETRIDLIHRLSELDEETAEAFLKNQDKFHVYQSEKDLAKLLKIFRECDSETVERLATLPEVLFDGPYYGHKISVYETLKECDDHRLALIKEHAPHFFGKKSYGNSLEASLRIIKSLVNFDEGLFPLVKQHFDDLLKMGIYRDTLFESIASFNPDVFQLFFHNRHKLLPDQGNQDFLEILSSFTHQNMEDALKYLDIKDENYYHLLKHFKNVPSEAIPLFLELSRFVNVYEWGELSKLLGHERDFEASRQQILLIFNALSQYDKGFDMLKKILDFPPEALKAISENAEALFGHRNTKLVLDFLKNESTEVIRFFAQQMPFIFDRDRHCCVSR